ncbi:MAG: DUF4302 domain-containing protein [Prevotella sp.]|jgi:hypothetical protein|nr:DUF4302 domain-containing protein [Prevotella sp.]
MKRTMLILTLLLGMFSSCDKKMDPIFDEPADARLQAAIDHYQKTLTGSPNGWILTVNTTEGGVYRFWTNFTEDGRVVTLSDASASKAVEMKESSYQLKAIRAIMLTFDTGSYVADVADPQATVSGGAAGVGQGSDFEFYFMDEDNGALILQGRFTKVKATLVPATAAEVSVIMAGGLKKAQDALESYMNAYAYPTITIGEENEKSIQFSMSSRNVEYQYLDASKNLVSEKVNSYVDLDGLVKGEVNGSIYLSTPVSFAGENIIRFDWNEANAGYVAVTAENSSYDVYDYGYPIFPISTVWGASKAYNSIRVEKSQLTGTLTGPFLALYDGVNTKLGGISNRRLGYIDFRLYADGSTTQVVDNGELAKDVLEVTFRYLNSAGTGYDAQWYYKMSDDDNGVYSFTCETQRQPDRTNENNTKAAYGDVFNYLKNNKFIIDWAINNTSGSSAMLGGLYVADENGNKTDDFICGALVKR